MARVLISREMRLWSFDAATSWYENVPKTIYGIFRAVSFINYAYVADSSFGMHSAYVSLALIDTTKRILPRKLREPAPGLQVSATTLPLFDTECSRSPPRGGVHRYEYSHPVLDRHWGSLRYSLTPTAIRSEFPVTNAKRHVATDIRSIFARASETFFTIQKKVPTEEPTVNYLATPRFYETCSNYFVDTNE